MTKHCPHCKAPLTIKAVTDRTSRVLFTWEDCACGFRRVLPPPNPPLSEAAPRKVAR